MGRKSRQREEEMLAGEQKITNRLSSHTSQTKKKFGALGWQEVIFKAIAENHKHWINAPSTWVNTKKTKNIDALRHDMVRYVFGVYKCPKFLEDVWLPTHRETYNYANHRRHESDEIENKDVHYVAWYLTVAQGGSLYKSNTKGILTKKETHAFLHAPKNNTVKQNIWWARAYCESDNIGTATRIAQSRLVNRSMSNEFWISVMRFFSKYPTSVNEINDLLDYFIYALQENEDYTLKGRSLEAVKISCVEWHRFLNKQKSIGGGTWAGSAVDNGSYTTGKDEHKVKWLITQIRTGNELLKEGQKMRHCVVSYKRRCSEGHCSIWSLTSHDMIGNNKRCLTVELSSNNQIIQCRGLANRMPRPIENNILGRWCVDNSLQANRNSRW